LIIRAGNVKLAITPMFSCKTERKNRGGATLERKRGKRFSGLGCVLIEIASQKSGKI